MVVGGVEHLVAEPLFFCPDGRMVGTGRAGGIAMPDWFVEGETYESTRTPFDPGYAPDPPAPPPSSRADDRPAPARRRRPRVGNDLFAQMHGSENQ